MCCARTAALHCGNEKQKVNASKVFFAAIPAACRKMPPRAKKYANMRDLEYHFGRSWPPLVRKCSMLMQAKNAVGFNTPGAARSTADLVASWRPKSFQNRCRKCDVFSHRFFQVLAWILEGLGPPSPLRCLQRQAC